MSIRFNSSGSTWDYIEAFKIGMRVLERLISHCRSPIEELLGSQLAYQAAERGWVLWDRRLPKEFPQTERWFKSVPPTAPLLLFEPSRRFKGENQKAFIMDFFLANRDLSKVAIVECDSLSFHWGLSAKRDGLKNEFSAKQGWYMIRFLSKRIFDEAPSCAKEILDYMSEYVL